MGIYYHRKISNKICSELSLLHYAGICEAVRDFLSKFNFPHFSTNIARPYLPVFLDTLLRSRSGTESINDQLVKKEIFSKAVGKWTIELSIPEW